MSRRVAAHGFIMNCTPSTQRTHWSICAQVEAALAAGADPFPALENATLATRSLLTAAAMKNACEGVSPGERKRLGVHCVARWYDAYLPWVEYTGRNALVIGLGIFPVVFVAMFVAAMRWSYATTLCRADGATRDDLLEAVMTLEDTERTARRVLGGAHPVTDGVEETLRNARRLLRARETPSL